MRNMQDFFIAFWTAITLLWCAATYIQVQKFSMEIEYLRRDYGLVGRNVGNMLKHMEIQAAINEEFIKRAVPKSAPRRKKK